MYTNEIHPYLVARLLAIHDAFADNGLNNKPRQAYNNNSSNDAGLIIANVNQEDQDESSGGGTARGYRGKNSALQKAKDALRKITR